MKRILVVGAGLIGIRHLRHVEAHPGCAVAGLVDPSPDIQLTGIPRFRDLSEVNVPVDGVIIATPTGLHGEHGAFAAERGWPMLIEKPVTGTLAEADALRHTLRRTGVPSLVGHHRRHHPRVLALREAVHSGRLGTVVSVSMLWLQRKPDDYYQGNWRTNDGSPIMINTVHDLDILRFVFGEICDVTALRGKRLRDSDRVESAAIALRFESGAIGTIAVADTAPSPWAFEAGTGENPNIATTGQDMMWIAGTQGSLSFPSLTHWSGASDWSQTPGAQTLPQPAPSEPLRAQLDHFLEVIDGAAPRIDVADATRSLELTLQIEDMLKEPEHA